MPKLNDTQSILLSTASLRADYSFYPIPDALAGATRTAKAVSGLISAGFAEEREAVSAASISRIDGDINYGIFATPAGLAAIAISGDVSQGEEGATTASPVTKVAAMRLMLQQPDGATLADLIAMTGWLPHTTRAALTGLRKKGHAIERFKQDGATAYRIAV